MSLRSWLQPPLAAWLLSPARLARRRQRAESRRIRRGQPHQITWYHRPDDPYSHLLAQALLQLREQYDVALVCRTVPHPPLSATPEPARLAAYAIEDARALCAHLQVGGKPLQLGLVRPDAARTAEAAALLTRAEQQGDYLADAVAVGEALWRGAPLPVREAAPHGRSASAQLQRNEKTLHKGGHYLSGMLQYAGEWFWGLDRLRLLTARLEELGAGSGAVLTERSDVPPAPPARTLDVFLSVRSPYSYLALERVIALGQRHAVEIRLRPVLPMVMRGLAVPLAKRLYIVRDAAREASRLGIAFGRICDPLPAVERVLAIYPHAAAAGRGEAYLQAAMSGAWARGIDLGTTGGLRRVVEEAGLSWSAVQAPSDWRALVEGNRAALGALGLWGVPSFSLGGFATWGQDRLWLLERRLQRQTR